MTDTGIFGTKQRPAILDPSQLIRNVVWGVTELIGVLEFRSEHSGESPQPYLSSLRSMPFGSSWDLNSEFKYSLPNKPPTVVEEPQLTTAMRTNLLMWSYVPNKTEQQSTQTITTEIIDLAHYVGYVNGFPFFGGDFQNAEDAYASFAIGFQQVFGRPPDPLDPNDLWVNMNNVLQSHTETTSRTVYAKTMATMVFLNLAAIGKKFLSISNPILEFEINTGPATTKEGARWFSRLSTWRKNKKFPPRRYVQNNVAMLDPLNWDVTRLIQFREVNSIERPDNFPALPGNITTYAINCVTLQITKAQRVP